MNKKEVFSVIFDLEATCWDRGEQVGDWHGVPSEIGSNVWKQQNEMEIIEIGAVKVRNSDFEILDKFQTFIRPVLNPILTDFCKNLTTISQEDVDNAPYFKEAFIEFRKWSTGANLYIGWGQYDYKQIKKDCASAGISCFSENKYINGKEEYRRLTGVKGRGLGKMVKKHNLVFEGTHHRAISDAIMTAKVLQEAKRELEKKMKKKSF